ncbi:hypothetical protein J437_LFUL009676 [Ladona fulva]|uniref:Uncharacterized protein n=1 Tax=Ladona fulva TaxID=123851 RepID=A0A8K0P2K1_LADFU|nr:hypothetical protein J437_LFUL009676 [Ladona fulva]
MPNGKESKREDLRSGAFLRYVMYDHHQWEIMEDNRRMSSSVSPRTGSISGRKGGSKSNGGSSRASFSGSSHSSDAGEELLHLHPHPLPGTRPGSSAERPIPTADKQKMF